MSRRPCKAALTRRALGTLSSSPVSSDRPRLRVLEFGSSARVHLERTRGQPPPSSDSRSYRSRKRSPSLSRPVAVPRWSFPLLQTSPLPDVGQMRHTGGTSKVTCLASGFKQESLSPHGGRMTKWAPARTSEYDDTPPPRVSMSFKGVASRIVWLFPGSGLGGARGAMTSLELESEVLFLFT